MSRDACRNATRSFYTALDDDARNSLPTPPTRAPAAVQLLQLVTGLSQNKTQAAVIPAVRADRNYLSRFRARVIVFHILISVNLCRVIRMNLSHSSANNDKN